MGQPFESAYQLVDQVAKAFFDTLYDRRLHRLLDRFSDWLLWTLILFTHAVRLSFSMSAGSTESTPGDDFEFRRALPTL